MKTNKSDEKTISIVIHRLKNPIAVIRGYLDALISGDCGKINEKQEEYLKDALLNVKTMSKNIDNFIDASRIETGEYNLNIQEVDLNELISSLMKDFKIWAIAANSEINFKKEGDIPLVLTDSFKIKKVIENLISNAIKYNDSKGVVKISLEDDKEKKEVLFSCKDNGIEIPEEDYNKVFTKFYRSEKSTDIDLFGSGLSLYISKAIIELSGGKIWFEKNKDRGMTFYFSLPIANNK